MKRFVAALLFALLAAGVSAAAFRFSRPIETRPGWARLEIPDDVLDACRPGLPDLRIFDESGKEVAYALESQGGRAVVRVPLQNVESVAGRETTALVDRGRRPPLAQSATLEIEAEDFLKPVVLEASEDGGSWKQIARGSVFSTGGLRWATLRFAANDRRFLRFRMDDRNGPPVAPLAAWIEAAGSPESKPREIRLAVGPAQSGVLEVSRFEVSLPSSNLGITALRFEIAQPAYWRRVRVFERVFFRDELSRRLVGEGTILRSPGSEGQNVLPICEISGKNLEVEIEDGDSGPLSVSGVTGLALPRVLTFLASEKAHLTLEYGSAAARVPRYDLSRALSAGRPASENLATLGAREDRGAQAPALLHPPPGQAVDPSSWTDRRRIELPDSGSVAYLDLDGFSPSSLAAVRLIDRENRQVPYVVEQDARQIRVPVRFHSSVEGTKTIAAIEGLNPSRAIESIELAADGLDYFSRDVAVWEDERDVRGVTGRRILGTARWERRPEEPPRPLHISIARPSQTSVRAEIENGDNAPIRITQASAWISAVRIDFVFSRGEDLDLLSGNPEARPPRYDLAMIAGRVLESPARAANFGPARKTAPAEKKLPPWFWAATVLGALLLLFGLGRALKSSPTERL